jgi:hypothetical protein
MHERTVQIAVAQQIPQDVHDLGVVDRGRFKVFASGGSPGENEDARADDGPNSEGGQRPGAKGLLQAVARLLGVRNQLVDRLAGKKLIRQRLAPAPGLQVEPLEMCVE